MMNVSSGVPSNLRSISFVSAVMKGDRSPQELFLMIDALIALEWKVSFTFLKQLYCCGAEKSCSLPKWTGDFGGVATEESFHSTVHALDFAFDHFDVLETMDDLFILATHFPPIFDWYQKNSHRIGIGKLDNNHLLRQTPYITKMKFPYIGEINLGPTFVTSQKAVLAAADAISALSSVTQIMSIRVAKPQISSDIDPIIKIATARGIFIEVVDERESPYERFEMYEDHSIFLVQDAFYLTRTDHLGCASHAFANGNTTPIRFLTGMLKRKIEIYKGITDAPPELQTYFDVIGQQTVVNDNPSVIPMFMINRNTKFFKKLCQSGYEEYHMALMRRGIQGDDLAKGQQTALIHFT